MPTDLATHTEQWNELARLLCVGFAILAASALVGLPFATPPQLALFWPPAGIALAALACWGWRMSAALIVGAWCAALLQGVSVGLALLLTLSLLAGPVLALLAMWRLGFKPQLDRRIDWLLFLGLGVIGGSVVSAAAGIASQQLFGQLAATDWLESFICSAAAHALGILAVSPLLMTWHGTAQAARPSSQGLAPRLRQSAASLAWVLASGLCAWLIFFDPLTSNIGWSPWLFLPHLLLCGLAFNGSFRAASAAALLLTLLAAAAAAHSTGPFATLPMSQNLALFWGFAGSIVALPLLIHSGASELRRHSLLWRKALASSGLGVAQWRIVPAGGYQTYACVEWLKCVGAYAEHPGRVIDWLAAAHPLDKDKVSAAIESLLLPGAASDCCASLRLAGPASDWKWFELKAHVQKRDLKGRATQLLTTLSDVSWRHTAEERQRMSASLFQHLHEGLLITDTEQVVLDANPSYCRIVGLSRDALIGRPAAPLQELCLHRSGLTPEQMKLDLREKGSWQGLVQTERADGSPCHLQLTVSSIPEPDGPLRYWVVSASDATESLRQQALLRRQASIDPLTGLANADAFMQMLRQALRSAEREGFRLSICRVDMDQFKQINKQYGSSVADTLLQQAGQRLQAALRSAPQWSDGIARLGGDEFGLLLRSNSPEEAQLAMERLLKVLSEPYQLSLGTWPTTEDLSIIISASIGATQFPQDNSDAETLLRHAGHALYRVKHSGRHGYQLFDSAKRLRDEASLIALARVQQALDAGELRLHYQPKVDMQSGQVLGMEALLRWQHPDRGLLAPVHFLPLIESTGLGLQVGDWVLEQALRQSAQWLGAGLTLSISVNVTARQLQTADFAQRLQELINRHSEPVAAHLCLEVLESAALADISATHSLIQQCRGFGVSFALDDFGTGYSTLTYLKRLPVDVLKIDRSFVQNMLIDEQDSNLVEGVIRLAGNFGCTVVAEGVESAAHARALLRLGCRQGQGNGIAPAMPATEVQAWVAAFANIDWLPPLGGRSAALL